ncbi:Trm112p-domain-containing protein [Neocallimastix lanati (nom. inval.)]|nr:Trm112p-domain-containing protein [Neocallimastix sp. JGI-2020a]
MRLLTHNMLQCHVKGCNIDNFPLKLEEIEIEELEAEFNVDFINSMLNRLDWRALVHTPFSLGIAQLPEEIPEELNDEMLKQLHHILLEIDIISGRMVCKGCNHVYPIRGGIPNMLLTESEI